MLAAQFGLAAGIKSWAPSAPLWALMVATQLLDLIFLLLNLGGVEKLGGPMYGALDVGGGAGSYSHSLAAALVLAAVVGIAGRVAWGGRAGAALAAVVVGHWLFDLLLHTDLPLLPGNAGNLPLLGLGLGSNPTLAAIIEAVVALGGAFLYWRTATRLPAPSIRESVAYRSKGLTAAAVVAGLLLLALLGNILGVS